MHRPLRPRAPPLRLCEQLPLPNYIPSYAPNTCSITIRLPHQLPPQSPAQPYPRPPSLTPQLPVQLPPPNEVSDNSRFGRFVLPRPDHYLRLVVEVWRLWIVEGNGKLTEKEL